MLVQQQMHWFSKVVLYALLDLHLIDNYVYFLLQ